MFLIIGKLKIFGFVSKHVLCHIETVYYFLKGHMFLEIIKYIHKFVNLKNTGVTGSL